MKKSKFVKKLERNISWFSFLIACALSTFIPERAFPVIARYLEVISRPFTKKWRKIAWDNLVHSLGKEKPEEEIRYIHRACFMEVGRNFFEMLYTMLSLYRKKTPLEHLRERVSLEGEDNLKEALSLGRGVIGLSAHFGNFTMMGAGFTSRGYSFALVVRPTDEPRVERYFQQWRDRLNYESIPALPRSLAVRRSLLALRKNKILALFADQNKAKGGVFVDFFGRPAGTVVGPAVMALRTGAPIVPMFTLREGIGRHKVIIGKPLNIQITGDQERDILYITAEITKAIEEFVRKYPAHWWWFHNRWKTKPKKIEILEKEEVSTPLL